MYQYNKTNQVHPVFSVYYELTASTCLDNFCLITRRHFMNGGSNLTLLAAGRHNTYKNIAIAVFVYGRRVLLGYTVEQ
jgi:hypothetical protein